jgi:hypothetical protein
MEDSLDFTPQEELALLRKQVANLQRQRAKFRVTVPGFAISVIAGAGIGVFFAWAVAFTFTWPDAALGALTGGVAGPLLYSAAVLYFRFIFYIAERNTRTQLLKKGAQELQESISQDFVTKLVQINFKYIDQYYEQTQIQAGKSFLLAAFASVTGLAVIVTGVVMMFRGLTEPAYVTAGAGVLSEFVAAVFFYLYNRTIEKMGEYHQKLVVTQNVSLALKITDDLQGEARITAQQNLIDRLTQDINAHLTKPISPNRHV